jgi:hypothetical protein
VCKEDETPLPPVSDAGSQYESGVGGPCGGVVGYRCQEGLVCNMTAEQESISDGMGQCGRKATCVRGTP